MENLSMDTAAVEDAARKIGGEIAQLVTQSFTQAPSAAASAAGMNSGYMTSYAMIALIGTQLLQAVQQLNSETTQQSELLQLSATTVKERDQHLATQKFTIDPATGR
jgi:hypothetical protein